MLVGTLVVHCSDFGFGLLICFCLVTLFTAETLVTAELHAVLAGLFVTEFSVVSGIEFRMSALILTGGLQKVME